MATLSVTSTSSSAPVKNNPNDYGHRFDANRHWAASLTLGFKAYPENNRLITRMNVARHYGPLRVQRPFYPEGRDGCCHLYLLHPPGGIASGDSLTIDVDVNENAQTLLTTPAANKLYRADSNGVAWAQHTHLKVAKGGALEWLPQETIAFDGSLGKQTVLIDLAEGGKCLGWEVIGLGRPASNLPFASGNIEQRFTLTRQAHPLWIERQLIDPKHARFMGKWGQGGASVHATLWATGFDDSHCNGNNNAYDDAINALRERINPSVNWAVTHRRGVLLLRYMGKERNEAWDLLQQARDILRPRLLGVGSVTPRIWLT